MPKFLFDAGPLIHLDQIGQLKLLKKISPFTVPRSVAEEIRRSRSQTLKTFLGSSHVQIVPVSDKPIIFALQKASLHSGEKDCLRLALKMSKCVFLTDDLAARTTAEKFGIEVHGSVGLIAYGFKQKWMSLKETENALTLLHRRSNLFVTDAIIEEAIRSLRKSA